MKVLRGFFTENKTLKVAAVLSACLIWFYINEKISEEKDVRGRIEFEVSKERLVRLLGPQGEPLDTDSLDVWITVKGPRGKVNRISPGEPLATVVIDDDTPDGPLTREISGGDFDFTGAEDVSITKVRPSKVSLRIERAYSRFLPVRVVTTGSPAGGYVMSRKPRVTPSEVSVRGPEGVLKSAKHIETFAVDVTGHTRPLTIQVGLVGTVTADGEQVPVTCDERVSVEVFVEPEPVEKTIKDIPVRVLGEAARVGLFEVSPPVVSVRLRGAPSIVPSLSVSDVLVFADVTGIDASVTEWQTVKLSARVPEGVVLVQELPSVRVKVRKSESGKKGNP